MRITPTNFKRTASCCFASLAILCALAAAPLLSSAHPSTAGITVVNNSSREIRHIYLSPTDQDDWGPDQLNNVVLNNGQSVTISNPSCSGAEVKVIGEDKDGCFVSSVVSCTSDATWTITNDSVADCGQ
jgi:hypothetical protein